MGQLWSTKVESTKKLRDMDERMRWDLIVKCFIHDVIYNEFSDQMWVPIKYGHFWGEILIPMIIELGWWVDYSLSEHHHLYPMILTADDSKNISRVTSMVISHDGYHLYSAHNLIHHDHHHPCDHAIIAWDITKCAMIQQWTAHRNDITDLAHHSRQGLLVSCSKDRTICVWNSHSRDYPLMIHHWKKHSDQVLCVDINIKGTLIISGSRDNSVRVWRVETGECIRVLNDIHRSTDHCCSSVTCVLFIGELIVSGMGDNSMVMVWDPSYGLLKYHSITELMSTLSGGVCSLSVNSDASLLACQMSTGVYCYTWPGLQKVLIKQEEETPKHLVFHPVLPNVLALVESQTVRLTNVIRGECVGCFRIKHEVSVNRICFTPDGSRLISISDNTEQGSIMIWDVTSMLDVR